MKVHDDNNPGAFSFAPQPKRPGYVLIRFYENVTEYKDEFFTGWQYDEYHLELPARPDMQTYLENHLYELKAEAKGGASAVTQLMAQMEAYNTANQLAIAELAEAMLGGAGDG